MSAGIFTPRELQILRLMVEEGLRDKEIAEIFGWNPDSVKQKRCVMLKKLTAYLGYGEDESFNKTDLAIFAIVHQLVDSKVLVDRFNPVRRAPSPAGKEFTVSATA
jgi:DNA-binding NarL/FixJ family response regulator